ncbi:hypothetical protein LTR37_010722 [Vermiconidia calcicola]|uniref:Uncharacterized protein n=1 Tax=Vermiconidia calcicola TaxID=1690605 RepID=A0ACC3N460_9PEZI|nr:hypothetical protein LTR37_010722 [Vermiconidia calcicola]
MYYPNCTLPSESVSYVAAPNVRSTLDIVWSLLATIIACTNSVLHLSVPEQRQGRDPGWQGDIKWSWRRLRKSLRWTIIIILAPEYVLASSVEYWFDARRQMQQIHRSVPPTVNTWTMVHMLFADMGGFVIRTSNFDLDEENPHQEPVTGSSTYEARNGEHHAERSVALTDSFGHRSTQMSLLNNNSDSRTWVGYPEVFTQQEASIQMDSAARSEDADNSRERFNNGSSQREDAEEQVERQTSGSNGERVAPHARHSPPKLLHLDAYTVRCAIEESILSPDIPTTEEIMDKSKSDLFTKLLTLIQII